MFGKKKRSPVALVTGASIAALGALTPSVASAQAQESRVSDEIIVTAQKREQNIQDVPIAVTALSGNDLEQGGVADIRALQTLSASINLNSSQTESGGTTLRIRGVGTTGNNAGLESSVGVFIDGIYVSRPAIALGELLDVQQIEILRGPQGTLFGRNTSAGALTITTRAPSLTDFGAFGNITVGAIDGGDLASLASSQGGVNIPLVEDKLAIRFSAAARVRDGLLTSTDSMIEQNSRDRFQLRGQALWAPTDDISIRLIADYAEGNDDCCDAVILRETPFVASGSYALAGLGATGGVFASGFGALDSRTSNSRLFRDPGEQSGFSAQLDWDLGFADLTYIGATRNALAGHNVQESDFVQLNVFTVGGPDAVPAGFKNNGRTNYDSHELRLTGEAGRLTWLVGAYYGDESISTRGALSLGNQFQANVNANIYGALAGSGLTSIAAITGAFTPSFGAMGAAAFAANPAGFLASGASPTNAFAFNVFDQQGETTSVFTHNTLAVTDSLDITVGVRYVDESKHGVFTQPAASNPACTAILGNAAVFGAVPVFPIAAGFLCFPFARPAAPGSGVALFDRTFEDEELVYTANASYAFTDDVRAYASFTHGFKSGGFNLDPTAAGGTADPRFKSEKVDAFEVGVKSEFADGRIRANAAAFYSDIEDFQVLEFTGVQFQTFNVPSVEAKGAELELQAGLTEALGASLALTYSDAAYPSDCAPATASAVVRTLCGSKLTNAPEWVAIFGLNYDHPVGPNHRVFASGSARWEDDRRTSTQEFEVNATGPVRTTKVFGDIQEANTKVNLRFGFGSQDESWALELWGTNIFNEQTRNVTFNTPLRGFSAATNSRGAFLEEPAIYGVTIRANY